MRFKLLIIMIILVTEFVSLISVSFGETLENQVVPEPIKNAILAEDWNTVADLCGPNEQLESSPVLRAIKGHACLALNRNNESLLLFLSVNNNKDSKTWEEWTRKFVEDHEENHVAHYFKGDALARIGKWDSAIMAFNEALNFSDLSLALNARGVVYAYKQELKKAREDFKAANKLTPKFADAYASFGTLQILKKASKGAYKSFDKALARSTEFALALNGLGCAKYGHGVKNWEQAYKDFSTVVGKLPFSLFVENSRGLLMAVENTQMPGQESSSLFRLSDFLDWVTLRRVTSKKDDILHIALGSQLPETLDVDVIDRLNKLLDESGFYAQIHEKIIVKQISVKLQGLISETATLRNKSATELIDEEIDKIHLLNRMLIEEAYPYLIAQHDMRNPGTHLSSKGGLIRPPKNWQPWPGNKGPKPGPKLGHPPGEKGPKEPIWPEPPIWVTPPSPFPPDPTGPGGQGLPPAPPIPKPRGLKFTPLLTPYPSILPGPTVIEKPPGGALAKFDPKYTLKGEWPVTNIFGLAYVSR